MPTKPAPSLKKTATQSHVEALSLRCNEVLGSTAAGSILLAAISEGDLQTKMTAGEREKLAHKLVEAALGGIIHANPKD